VGFEAQPTTCVWKSRGSGASSFPCARNRPVNPASLANRRSSGAAVETLTDLQVRDTWEIPKSQVRATWSDAFGAALDAVRYGLGLPSSCELGADFHAMLVYEKGQFFVGHQDSETDDAMVGTLPVTLPSAHTGGELVIEHAGDAKLYQGVEDCALAGGHGPQFRGSWRVMALIERIHSPS
jgi:hypothetical protein